MTMQYEPNTDPNWDHLRAVLAKARMEAPKPRNYRRIIATVALTALVTSIGMLVKIEVAEAPAGAIGYAIEQFEAQVTDLGQQALAAVQSVVNAEPTTAKPTPKVSKPKKTSMLTDGGQPAVVAANQIRVEESVRELPKFQVEIVDRNRRQVVNADEKRMMVEIAQPGAMSAAGDEPMPVRFEPVVLRAHINRDGAIETLTKLSGPAELANAAIETVKGLHYQPSYRNGSAIETETEITVNFVPTK